MRKNTWQIWSGWLFALPWLIQFVFFIVAPFVASFYLSLTNYRFRGAPKVIGWDNYVELFSDDPLFWKSVVNTIYYTIIHVPGQIVIAFLIALLLNQNVRGIALWRTMFYLPSITAGVATAMLWIVILQPNGLLNQFLGIFGIPGPRWLTSTTWAMQGLILMSFWTVGTTMILYLAGLQGIPTHLYEAAEIVVLGIIGSFQVFTSALIVTSGGPANSTLFVLLYLYRKAFLIFQMGYASAIAWVLFVIILLFTVVQFAVARRWVHYEYED